MTRRKEKKTTMTFEEHQKKVEETFKLYDAIDFVPYIKKSETLNELWDVLCDEFNYTDFTNNETMKGSFFNVMSEDRFIRYLKNRYGSSFSTTIYTDHYINFKEEQ